MTAQVTEPAAALWDGGSRWDGILAVLRDEGSSKADCIKATAELLGVPLADAKRLVHDSDAWADVRLPVEPGRWHPHIPA